MDESRTPEHPVAEDSVELRLLRHEPISFRAWFYAFVALLAVLAAVRIASGNTSLAAILAAYLGYMSICCTFCPLPTTPVVLAVAVLTKGSQLPAPVLVVATLGAAGTAIANLHDYYLLTFLYRYRPVRRVRRTALYRRFAAWYGRAPFATLAAASFLPIPVDFVRLLAISEGYHRAKFILGSLVGRWPRYLLLAYLAHRLEMTWQWVLGIGGATVVLGCWRGLPPLIHKLRGLAASCRHVAKETLG